jgi:amino acid adenylation domain-containing protein
MTALLSNLLTDSAARVPDREAAACRGETLTYGELDRESNRLAALLAAEGVRAGDRVGIFLPKSVDGLVAVFGVLKAGAAYVPIDPKSPAIRASYMIRDCGIRTLITTGRQFKVLAQVLREGVPLESAVSMNGLPAGGDSIVPHCRLVDWRAVRSEMTGSVPEIRTGETDLAYVLYTSGSTGHPKGVMLSHRNALAFVDWAADYFRLGPEDRVSNHAPLHFDLSVFDLFATIKAGGTVFPLPEESAMFPVQVGEFIQDRRLTVWYSVPSALIQLLLHAPVEKFDFSALRAVLFAGEVFPVKHLRRLKSILPGADLYNLYGPTETNVCTFHRVEEIPADQSAPVPIGRACAGSEVFALNPDRRPVRKGETGELYVRGPTVMMGYWGKPDRTAEVLVADPLRHDSRAPVCRTGDQVTLNDDGEFVYVGRRDHMIKSRGFRIELGEIEAVLNDHPKIQEAAVVPVPDEEIGNRIKAVVVPVRSETLTPEEVGIHCAGRLPRYMVPEIVEFCEVLPRTSTGKTDRRTLSEKA